MNETISGNQDEHDSALAQHYCLDMEIRKSPEGRSTSSDRGAAEEADGFWRVGAGSIYEGKSPLTPELGGCDPDGAEREFPPPPDAESSSVGSETERLSAERPPGEDVRRDMGVVYDDVPAENSHPPEVDGIYEEIQRPEEGDFPGWSSSEFESYDELSESENAPPNAACKHNKRPGDVQWLKEHCAVARRELAVHVTSPHLAHLRQSCDTKVQQLMKAASSGTKNSIKRTKLAMFRKVTFLQRKDSKGEGKDDAGYVDVTVCELKHPPPQLCPMPEGLSNQQVVRRLILSSIVQSEWNYLDSLRRIIQEYQKPLLEPPRSILNPKKVCQIFYRLQEIFQCHSMFQIALGSRVAEWDHNEKIGDLFVASFSKSMVLNVYSDYINNFTNAMALIKKACMSKPAFLDFLKRKQASSPDRITLYGLMVKPIQRFPQFILLLQDMLKNTPRSHGDRLSLQLALTELETLAQKLNEQKRLADQEAEIQQLALSGGDRAYSKLLNSEQKQLLHCELLTEVVYGEKGQVLKSRERKVFLLNDTLICVNVNPRVVPEVSSLVPVGPRYTVKWCVPLLQTQVVEVGQERTLRGRKHSSSSSSTGFLGPPRLYEELEELQHDLAVVEEVSALVGTLSGVYQNLNSTVSQDWCRALQRLIRLKEEEIQNANKRRLRLAIPGKPDKSGRPASVMVVFNTPTPLSKIHWVNRLHLAKIALRKENSPGWECVEDEKKTKASLSCPMLICRLPVFSCTAPEMKLQAALHSPSQSCLLGFCSVTTSLPQGYLWVVGGGTSTHGQVEIFSLNRTIPRPVKTVPLASPALSLHYVKESSPAAHGQEAERLQSDAQTGNIICVGLQDGSINVYSSVDTAVQCLRTLRSPGGSPVLCLQHFLSFLLAGLDDGRVAVYQHSFGETLWDVEPCRFLSLGCQSVCPLLAVEDSVWAGCGNNVSIVQGAELHTQSFKAHPDPGCSVTLMVHWGRGVWMAFARCSSIQLFHTETLEALQEVNLSARTSHLSPGCVCVSSLLMCQGLLWVGTNQGIILTFPAPTLDGIPKITGKGMTSLNAHHGPVDFLVPASSSLASSLLRRDSIINGNEEEADEEEGGRGGDGVENGAPPPSRAPPSSKDKPKSLLLQYSLQSTRHLPGRLLSTEPDQDQDWDRARPAPLSPEHGPEDGSIYEVSEDPDVWVRGRPVDCWKEAEGRRGRVTSVAVFSGGRGFRRVGQEVPAENWSEQENTLLAWQLPLTMTEQQAAG